MTRFFRDPDSFDVLVKRAFPTVVESRREDLPVRVWVPGCSTGEEPYSLTIALLEFLDKNDLTFPLQVFATDVSESAVEFARACALPGERDRTRCLPEQLRRFFNKIDGQYRIAKHVRDCCIFARQDITRDPPFSKIDLVLCRNVLIYLGPAIQKRLMAYVFHYALKTTGFLQYRRRDETVGPYVRVFLPIVEQTAQALCEEAPARRARGHRFRAHRTGPYRQRCCPQAHGG